MMKIELGSEWVDDKSGLDVVVESIIEEECEKTRVVYKLFDNTGNYLGYNSCTYEVFLVSKTPKTCIYEDVFKNGYDSGRNQWQDDYGFTVPNNTISSLESAAYAKGLKDKEIINHSIENECFKKGFEKGKELNKDNQNLSYRMGFNDGWHDCEASFELGNEFTDSIQEQAYEEGYDQAIDDLIVAGVVGEDEVEYPDEDYSDEDCSEECYSEYEFGDVEDDEEEYCFSKELERVLKGEFTSNINFDKDKKEDLVNNPSHYNSDPSGVKCIEITRHRNNNIGNVIKYVWRNGLKDGNSDIQDLEKAAWYLNDEIQRLKDIER